ncbi:Z1 domain-containing protein [Streptomyces endophyticus]|uniref:Z1 domain-containing protein n=1 Tax=Streptomyces endophyticus TaxID=714166 RepID=A0ABU6F2P0_9ACTN|nr:Z1 domain-containing protein [Streptomyces endophyticus]MEB8337892.1 Z1 domain-containing protein [Streptomyces endophyticus]
MTTTPAILLELHSEALESMTRRPRPFFDAVTDIAAEDYPDAELSPEDFRSLLASGAPALVDLWTRKLTAWDFAEAPRWSQDTPARSDERRQLVYERLDFDEDLRKALDATAPVHKEPGATVITREFTPWYTPERAARHAFYWPKYREVLERKGLPATAVGHLDEAAHSVVERLADPEQAECRQAKGLVVGYVQSGKTANFTGVTAKAIDAGYRLVIVLGGTLNLLRAQTQRRLDKELVGQENILGGADPTDPDTLVGIDYVGDDDEWDDFVSFGFRPSQHGHPDIDRLTTRDKDYAGLQQGIRALEFEKRNRQQPLHHPENLHHAAARIMVVKKNKAVLTKLVKNLKQIQAQGLLSEIPALIIDDESDQASVNTTDPKKWEGGAPERTAINGLISQLLTLLPRAQYVGYTATPFANVFVDPADSEDIFPNDFLISLRRPDGYMGVQDFHDLDSSVPPEDRTVANSQELAHVRGVYEDTGDRLQEALDAFLIAGAIKLYRAAHGIPEKRFRHHTMLVHESVRMAEHAELALRINTMWHNSAPLGPVGQARLRKLYDTDFAQVSDARADGVPTPASFDELRPHISRARQLINKGESPVIVVNGDKESDYAKTDLDFDRTPHVWKILVGGTKLSRGFTVEGLTVTYYRRKTQQADTLMQMGRWFGFREGYRDLVRLYIGREETTRPATATRPAATVDLYEAFEAICRDEEDFRTELSRYATLVDGHPQVTPSQIPPLVSQHLPWIKPSARNKMFNAELVEVRTPGVWEEPVAYPEEPEALQHNVECWAPVLDVLADTPVPLSVEDGRPFIARVGTMPHADLLSVLCELRWSAPERFSPHLEFLLEAGRESASIDDWFVIAPMQTSVRRREARILGRGPFTLAHRTRRRGPLFGGIREPHHVAAAMRLAGAANLTGNAIIEENIRPRRGALVLYPVVESEPRITPDGAIDPRQLVMAFAFVAPMSTARGDRRLVRFRAIDSGRCDAAIIDRDELQM